MVSFKVLQKHLFIFRGKEVFSSLKILKHLLKNVQKARLKTEHRGYTCKALDNPSFR